MKPKTIAIPSVLLVSSLLLVASGCNSEDTVTPAPTPTQIRGADSLQAYSASQTSVGLKWKASPDEGSSEVLNPAYSITARDTLGNSFSLTAVKGQTTATFGSLIEGRVYTFTIRMLVASGAVSTDSATVKWAPAKRRETEGSAPIQVFETASTTFFSGLDIYSASTDGPVTLSLTGSSNSLIDLFVFTEPGTQDLLIRSASLSTVIATPKTTLFSTVSDNADNLNFGKLTPPGAPSYSTLELRVSGAASGATAGKIFYGRTQENNYFRLLVVRNGTSLVFGASPDRFLTLKISYQSVSGIPYARPINPEPNEW